MEYQLKKIILFFILFILIELNCYAIEEITLPKQSINLDYLSDVYYGKVEDSENVSPILKLFSQDGLTFENGKINSLKATFLYEQKLTYGKKEGSSSYLTHDFFTVEPMLTAKFNNNKSKVMIDYNLTRNLVGYTNRFTERISQVYVSHEITPEQTILLGQGDRLPSSYDGSRGTMAQELVLKSQLGRTFGDIRSVGIRNLAKYKYANYDIGLYDSTRYMREFGNGLDFTGHVMLTPFADLSDGIKNIKVGSGYNIGHNKGSYDLYSVYAGYDYKKFHIHSEYANADGYNGVKESNKKAQGFYTIASYDITPKLEILGRYDYFIGDKSSTNTYTQEYTAGITYKVFKNMKFMLNYINKNNSNQPNSNMILFATRFII